MFCIVSVAAISQNKFQMILLFWHIVGNKNEKVRKKGRLDKVMPFIDVLNNKMSEIYVPEKDLPIGESKMLWGRRLVFRQYIKNKRHKYKVKFYELCQSDGLVLRERIYAGESTSINNSYSSFKYVKQVIKDKTYKCGTLRNKANPQVATKVKLNKGEMKQEATMG